MHKTETQREQELLELQTRLDKKKYWRKKKQEEKIEYELKNNKVEILSKLKIKDLHKLHKKALWNKACNYNAIRKRKENGWSYEDIINKPAQPTGWARRQYKFAFDWYEKQPEPKVHYRYFLQRVQSWEPKESAIKYKRKKK